MATRVAALNHIGSLIRALRLTLAVPAAAVPGC